MNENWSCYTMLLLSYFHPIIGPDFLITYPEDLLPTLDKEVTEGIKSLLDTANVGFFTHNFKNNMKTVNYFFTFKSPWARGEEMLMITRLTPEKEPNLEMYEKEFSKFLNSYLMDIKDSYQALYIKNVPSEIYRESIKRAYDEVKVKMEDLYNELQMVTIKTFGSMIPLQTIRDQSLIHIPTRFVGDIIKSYENGNEKVFCVFQYRDNKIKIEMIPVKCDAIFKITLIFSDLLSPDVVRKIGQIFNKYGLNLVYTSGICMQQGRCIYEVYLDSTNMPNTKILQNELKSNVDKIHDIKIMKIE